MPPHPAPQATAPQLHLLALDDIDAEALPRDRVDLDAAALADLEISIVIDGLRQPIEVFALATDGPGPRYGMISGYRRLTVMRRIVASNPGTRASIPAFLRAPRDCAEAMAQMIAENEIRADITPWERARIVLTAIEAGLFDTIDQAIPRLFPTYDHNRRARLRAAAEVVQHFGDHILSEPRAFSQKQLLRLAGALRGGMAEVMDVALQQSSDRTPRDPMAPPARDPRRGRGRGENPHPRLQTRPPPPRHPPPARPRDPPRKDARRLGPPLHRPRSDRPENGGHHGLRRRHVRPPPVGWVAGGHRLQLVQRRTDLPLLAVNPSCFIAPAKLVHPEQ